MEKKKACSFNLTEFRAPARASAIINGRQRRAGQMRSAVGTRKILNAHFETKRPRQRNSGHWIFRNEKYADSSGEGARDYADNLLSAVMS